MMARPRFDALDALRGVALVWMTVFHFCFDLNEFHYLRQDFHNDSVWTAQRSVILSLFLFCAGMGQAVALHQGQSWARFWRRWSQVAGCAVLVTAGSYLMFPRSFIYFGVLHGLAVMLLIVRATASWGNWLWLFGLLAIGAQMLAAGLLASSDWAAWFNAPGLNWMGLVTRKPITEDYVPLLPWIALMWWGVAAGSWLLRHGRMPEWQLRGPGPALAWLGRWSLSWYMLHQPVLIGVLLLAGLLLPK